MHLAKRRSDQTQPDTQKPGSQQQIRSERRMRMMADFHEIFVACHPFSSDIELLLQC